MVLTLRSGTVFKPNRQIYKKQIIMIEKIISRHFSESLKIFMVRKLFLIVGELIL